jgi:predicted DsbA family dithiol-disulfide isomerase
MCRTRPARGGARGVMAPVSDRVDVYFDYVCPYAWRAAELADLVARERGVRFEWHHFSLYQASYAGASSRCVWDERLEPCDETGGRGLLAFLASLAARRQPSDAFERFRLGLLRARHRDGRPFDRATVLAVAEEAGLHLASFERDLQDPESRTTLARQHCDALRREVHATPTFVFPGSLSVCLRLKEPPVDGAAAAHLYESVHELLSQHPYVETISRPRPRRN